MLDICSHSGGWTLFSMLLRSREGIGTMEARCSFRSIAISIQLRRMISHRHLQSNEGHSGRLHLLLSSSRLSPSSLAAVCRIAAAISSYIRPSRPFWFFGTQSGPPTYGVADGRKRGYFFDLHSGVGVGEQEGWWGASVESIGHQNRLYAIRFSESNPCFWTADSTSCVGDNPLNTGETMPRGRMSMVPIVLGGAWGSDSVDIRLETDKIWICAGAVWGRNKMGVVGSFQWRSRWSNPLQSREECWTRELQQCRFDSTKLKCQNATLAMEATDEITNQILVQSGVFNNRMNENSSPTSSTKFGERLESSLGGLQQHREAPQSK